ncbi:FUSC family protein [Corynebacterium pelargi]|uniref:Uncharacterized protein n=1 Tax=Corynebacterium pelargi TaxID=1471400 RepID=A0A410W6R4_9CORY|nr:FUSC family protein [Corynebacterium pelargi]QAU51576.1 hypothetical protein CPELA_01380 [Corynebacterium pelargi]GGG82455.1 hypothetical protein GCM10007338_21720 [Corynebacterium pelargi]
MGKQTSRTSAYLREIDNSLHQRVLRLRRSFSSILQASIAAGLAFWIAHSVVGHERPFFAPMSSIIILGLSSGNRLKRAVELSIGCSLGVGLGDLLILGIGSGSWQMALAIFVSLVVATFLSSSQLLINQVAIGSILIATIMPPGSAAGPERMFDAVIGCVVGIVVMALLPHSPLAGGRREVTKVLRLASSVLKDVSAALPQGDYASIHSALKQVRGSQGAINAMLEAAKSAQEDTRVSPLLWASKRRVRSFARILAPVDNVIRNTRVLARRAQVLTEDGDKVSAEQIAIIDELADITERLADVYARPGEIQEAREIPELVKQLRGLGARAGVDVATNVLSAQVILAQSRSIIVDLLQVCGMSRESAVAALVPTSHSPAFPPEVMDPETK